MRLGTRSETAPEDVFFCLTHGAPKGRKTEYPSSGVFERSPVEIEMETLTHN